MIRLILAQLILVSLVLTGCGSPTSTTTTTTTPTPTSEPPAEKPRVALIMKSLANEFFKTMAEGAEDYNKANSEEFSLITNGLKNEGDIAGQVALVEQMIAQGVDAIVIAPTDSKAMVAVLERAQKSGIVVVNIDNKLDTYVLGERGIKIPFVGPDNRAGAKLAGDYLAKHLSEGDTVSIIGGIPGAFNAIQRELGFKDSCSAAGLKTLSTQAGNWEMAKGNQVASGIINEHPEVKALLCANDNMALGAVAALKDAGKTEDILVIGYDNISAVQDLIGQGQILCTVDQHADQLAVYGIQYALEMIQGNSAPADRETRVDLVTAETLLN